MNSAQSLTPPQGICLEVWEKLAKAEGFRWAIAERNADGEVIGTVTRNPVGSPTRFKGSGKRGLILHWPLDSYAGSSETEPIFICEGASDTAALMMLGFDAVGIPMAGQCGKMLAAVLKGRHVVIVSDNDEAGQKGSAKLSGQLVGECASVRIIMPPGGACDARQAVVDGASAQDFGVLATQADSIPVPLLGLQRNGIESGAPRLVRLDEVEPELIQWLWPGRIALGKLTLLAGDPGLGKSFVTLDMAARLSSGLTWPDDPKTPIAPGGVVLLSAEDGIADTIRPRLDAAGADVSKIVAIESVCSIDAKGHETGRTFDLSKDIAALDTAITSVPECRLVIIDPITAYLGATDSHKNGEIRGLLAPLSALAEKYGVAIVAVTHLNKNSGGAAIYRTMGSLAFTAAARAAWVVSKDNDDPSRRLLLPIKNNIAPDTGGLAYRIEPQGVNGCPVVAWEPDAVIASADELLSQNQSNQCGGALEEAEQWLLDVPSDGPVSAAEIKETASRDGIKPRTLDRAKKSLGVNATREGYASDGRWVWASPHSAPTEPIERQP
ncbi:MAG: hypothetical protein COB69_03630 [Phycisphaera sp.]|nr:MAG: hypothetical protein COB69_03630 [Phycisphaera sp.]